MNGPIFEIEWERRQVPPLPMPPCPLCGALVAASGDCMGDVQFRCPECCALWDRLGVPLWGDEQNVVVSRRRLRPDDDG